MVYAANCLHSFEGEVSLGSLAVAVVDYSYGDNAATAARGSLRGILDSRGDGWTGSVIDAPCGQAAVLTGGQSYVLPPAFSPTGEETEILTAQFHAVIPVPQRVGDGQRMCLMAFSTPQITHWEKCYAPIMAHVLRSLRFTEESQGDGSDDVTSLAVSAKTPGDDPPQPAEAAAPAAGSPYGRSACPSPLSHEGAFSIGNQTFRDQEPVRWERYVRMDSLGMQADPDQSA
ncbi:hypothetical protein ACWGI9_27205 [Streptomyces sp. NPDC054833]